MASPPCLNPARSLALAASTPARRGLARPASASRGPEARLWDDFHRHHRRRHRTVARLEQGRLRADRGSVPGRRQIVDVRLQLKVSVGEVHHQRMAGVPADRVPHFGASLRCPVVSIPLTGNARAQAERLRRRQRTRSESWHPRPRPAGTPSKSNPISSTVGSTPSAALPEMRKVELRDRQELSDSTPVVGSTLSGASLT